MFITQTNGYNVYYFYSIIDFFAIFIKIMKFTAKKYNALVAEYIECMNKCKDAKKFYEYWLNLYYNDYIISLNAVKAYTTPADGLITFGIIFGSPELQFYESALNAQFEAMAIGDAYEQYKASKLNELETLKPDLSTSSLNQPTN